MPLPRTVFAVAISAVLGGCAGALWSTGEKPTRALVRREEAPMVPVQLNGQGPFTFLLGTTSDCVISSDAAKRLGLALGAPNPELHAMQVNEALQRVYRGLELANVWRGITVFPPPGSPTAMVQRVEAGGIAVENIQMIVADMSAVPRSVSGLPTPQLTGIDGVLGYQFLDSLRVTVDYHAHHLRFERPGPVAAEVTPAPPAAAPTP